MREHQKNCMFCKKPYIALRSDGMYCSESCKVQAFLKRRGLAPPGRARLIQENKELKQVVELYINLEGFIIPKDERVKNLINNINAKAKTLL